MNMEVDVLVLYSMFIAVDVSFSFWQIEFCPCLIIKEAMKVGFCGHMLGFKINYLDRNEA